MYAGELNKESRARMTSEVVNMEEDIVAPSSSQVNIPWSTDASSAPRGDPDADVDNVSNLVKGL
mgnify:FL=1